MTGCYWAHAKSSYVLHGPLTRYALFRVAHAPGNAGNVFPPLWVKDLDMHNGTCVTHVLWCRPGSPPSGFLWSLWRGKRSRHSWRMLNRQFYVSGKRPVAVSEIWHVENETVLLNEKSLYFELSKKYGLISLDEKQQQPYNVDNHAMRCPIKQMHNPNHYISCSRVILNG